MSDMERLLAAIDKRAEKVCPLNSREERRRRDSREAWFEGFREGAVYAVLVLQAMEEKGEDA